MKEHKKNLDMQTLHFYLCSLDEMGKKIDKGLPYFKV